MPADAVSTDAAPREIRLADYTPPPFLIDTVDLRFELNERSTRVQSRLAVRRNPAAAPGLPLMLDGEDLILVSIQRDGVPLAGIAVSAHGLTIEDMPDSCVLEIETKIVPADNTELSGLYVSGGNYFTQCEAQGFRRITYFQDRPDVMSRYTVTIAGDCPVMLSNGNPGPLFYAPSGRRAITWTDPHPKPCYLFALVAGDLVSVRDHFVTRSGRKVDLAIYVRRGDEDRCDHAMRSLKTSMTWDEDVFGLEYDLDVFNIAAVSDFNMGAMENKGLNVFNTKYVLARPETATDGDYQGIESVIAHEYFHNWTGNRVTCRDWFQLSLKEGLTVYRDQEFSADQGSRAVKRIGDVKVLRMAQFREDAGPLAHPVQPASYIAIDNFYTSTVYNKGAEVIRMMATIIGKDAFRRGMDLYFERHDNQAVTIGDFAQAMQDASGVDLTAFRLWYHQAGTPEVSAEDSYDADARRYTLTIRQETKPTPGQPEKFPQVIPVVMGLLDGNGQDLIGTRVLLADKAENHFVFDDIASPPVPSLFRDFSAPVKLTGLSRGRLRFLAAHDSDPFVRWDSGQQYAGAALDDMITAIQAGNMPALDRGVIDAAASALELDDPAFAAQMLSLPGEGVLADRMTVVDPAAIHTAREAARKAIRDALGDKLRARYDALTDTGGFSVDGAAMGRRMLRNVCLGYLNDAALAKAQFDARGNMTDVLAALSVLTDIDCAERADALQSFYQAWRGDALVLDKWFSIQAFSSLPGTLQAVRDLQGHPDFDMRNPNRIRALIGGFAANQARFHDASGAGYRLYADTIIALDPANAQLAARMVSPLGQWRRFDAGCQALMKAELQRILDLPGLSRNTFEMASKSIA
jgi:aminopeptidase N